MPISPAAETRLRQVENLLEDICDCFWTDIDKETGDEVVVTEDYCGGTVQVSKELAEFITTAGKLLWDEPVELSALDEE